MGRRNNRLNIAAILLVCLVVAGVVYYLNPMSSSQAGGADQSQSAPLAVKTTQATLSKARVWQEFPGRLEAVDRVEVRPRVSGEITKVAFEDGAFVKAGEVMFVIDTRPFEAEIASAQAALDSANSRVELSRIERERSRKLVKSRVVSKSNYDTADSKYKVALADQKSAKARLKKAKLDLEYANIKAPVSGKTSRAELTKGNLVNAANAPVLATIVANESLYADFDVDEQTYIRMVRDSKGEALPVEMKLSGDETFTYEGKIDSFDNQLDTRSGTIRARAIFDNKDGALVPGMYALVRLGAADQTSVLLLDNKAINTDQDRKFVYIIDENGQAARRDVQLGRMFEGKREIIAGLDDGQVVVTSHLKRLSPGMPVTREQEAAAPSDTQPAG